MFIGRFLTRLLFLIIPTTFLMSEYECDHQSVSLPVKWIL
jgi:hypothetical protein